MRIVPICLAILLSMAAGVEGAPRGSVKAKLVSDIATVKPGEAFHVGVELEITPGWHVYWTNPGDSGQSTEVTFALPEGFTVGQVMYPVPTMFLQPGDLVGYGYEDRVLLLAKVTPPKEALRPEEVKVSASASWLVCKEVCIPGSAALSASLQELAVDEASSSAIQRTLQRIPVKPADAPATVRFDGGLAPDAREGVHTIRMDWKEPVANVAFYPGVDEVLAIGDVRTSLEGRTATITFNVEVFAGKSISAETLDSVVAYDDADGVRRGIELPVPLKTKK